MACPAPLRGHPRAGAGLPAATARGGVLSAVPDPARARRGLLYGMASEAYHAHPALGSSTLKRMASASPWHAWKLGLDPARPVIEPSEAMRAGTLAHCAILEPASVTERYVVRPEGLDGRTRDGKLWLNDARRFGREVITFEQMETAIAQARAVREQLPEVADLLDGAGHSEVSAFWVREALDPASGEVIEVECKCRPDRVCEVDARSVVLLDIKTAKDAGAEGFARAIWQYRYDLQDSWYCEGYETASDVMVMAMVYVVVESDYPHAAAAYVLDDEARALARGDIDKLVRTYAQCKRANSWPGYPNTVQSISLPSWVRR